MDCNALEAEGEVAVEYPDDAEISVPIKGLAYNNGSDCISWIEPCYTDCSGQYGIFFGTPFLGNLYVTYNPDNFTVAFSQLVITNETRIEAI